MTCEFAVASFGVGGCGGLGGGQGLTGPILLSLLVFLSFFGWRLFVYYLLGSILRNKKKKDVAMELILVIVGLLLIVAAAWELVSPVDRRLSSWGKYKLPPGPKGQPIVGNMLDFWKRRREGTLASAVCNSSSDWEEAK